MVVFKVLFLLAAVHGVYPKPFLFKEMKVKKNFEFSLKPLLKPVEFVKEWKPFGPIKVEHKIEKRSPFPLPPPNVEPSTAPLLKVELEKSLELHSAVSPLPPHLQEEAKLNKQPPPPVGLPPSHEEIHEEHFNRIPRPPADKRLTRIDLDPASVSPPEVHRGNLPLHVGRPPVSPIPPLHVDHEDHLRETRLFGDSPPLGPHVPQVTVGYEQHLLVEPKPKVTLQPVAADEGSFHGFSKPPSVVIHGHPPPPPPPHLHKLTPLPAENGNEGTLDSFFGPERPQSARIQEEPAPPHHMPVSPRQVTGQGSFPVPDFAPPPPAGIQEKPVLHLQTPALPPKPTTQENNRGSLFTDISRVDEISAYIKAIDALPLVKPPLEEIVPGNSLDPVTPKLTVDAKAEPSNFTRRSRLALYFGNILLQVMSQAIGSARTAIGQYSMPSMI